MTVTPFVFDRDYAMVSEWWKRHGEGWEPVPPVLLSTLGFVAVTSELESIAAVWLYLTNSGWAWIEYLVTNPAADRKKRFEAIESLLVRVKEAATEAGAVGLITSTNRKGLQKLYERHGFVVGDTGVAQLVMRL